MLFSFMLCGPMTIVNTGEHFAVACMLHIALGKHKVSDLRKPNRKSSVLIEILYHAIIS